MQNDLMEIGQSRKLPQTNATILIADDDESIRTVLSQALARAGYQTRSTSNAATLWKWVKDQDGDLVLTDVMMPDGSIFEILPRIRHERPKLPIIVMSAQNTLLTAISAVEQGAYEYLPKPFDLQLLIDVVRRALEPAQQHRALVQKRRAMNDENLPMIGRSTSMQDVYRTLSRVAPLGLSVVIEGEVGVGKALIAKTIHEYSSNKSGMFEIINCAGLSVEAFNESLVSFQSLHESPTVYLANIDDGSLMLQGRIVALMTDLERVNGRVLASTSKNLGTLMRAGKMRPDLFYRLGAITIKVPPLRERLSDIGDLARLFLARANSDGLGEKIIGKGAIEALEKWTWPGNVRELENLIGSVVALNSESVIDAKLIIDALAVARADEVSAPQAIGEDNIDAARLLISDILDASKTAEDEYKNIYSNALRVLEKPLFETVLKHTRGNQIRAADLLGLNRNTLRKKLNELKI